LDLEGSHRTLDMENESSHNNNQDVEEDILVRLEEKFVDISCNMSPLMENLEKNL
jgi:hypothetical protein